MTPLDVELDHIGVVVDDLDAGARRWETLGFRLSPVSAQMGLNAHGEFEPWASANRCAVFERGYLELIGIVRPDCFNPWASFLARFEGAHIVAFRCDSADAAYPLLAAATNDFKPPVQRRRDAPYFAGGAWGTREMRFRNIFSVDEQVTEARYIVIEHETPDVLWQPALTDHPNGAVGFASTSFCTDTPETLRARLELFGAPFQPEEPAAFAIRCPRGGEVHVLTPDDLASRYPGSRPPAATGAIASCRVTVRDLAATRAVLDASGCDCHVSDAGVWVDAKAGNGTVVEFVQA